MNKRIGIIGAGTAGLQLGLFLRQHGIETTIYTDRRRRLPGGTTALRGALYGT